MVLSIMAYSLSASAATCWNTRSHTPALAQRLKRAAEAGLHLDPAAEALRQIAPGDTRAIAVEHGLDKEPVVLGGAADMPDPARQKVSDPLPLVIAQAVASHPSGPHDLTASIRSYPAPEAPK